MENLHYNILILIGVALFLGTIGGDLLKRLKIPGIVGFILTGVLIGQTGLGIIDSTAAEALRPFNYFALALIGFTIGGELRKDVFRKYGKSLLKILTFEGFGAFVSVFILTAACGLFFIDDIRITLALALLLGAIASATDPASPVNIIMETKSRGPLTTNILGIVALDDGFAVVLFALVSSAAGKIMRQPGLHHPAFMPFYEIFGAIALGIAAGLILVALLDRLKAGEGIAGFSLGLIILTAGLSVAWGIDMILAVMSFGFTVVNLRPEKSRQIFKLVSSATGPIFIIFFVMVGASLDIKYLAPGTIFIAAAYMGGMIGGKVSGARLGAKLSRAPESVCLYLPYCLFAQAGVAVGLTILASQNFPGEIGTLMVAVVTPSVFLLQIFAPFATRSALEKSGETGLNVTEKDLLDNVPVSELFEKSPPTIHEDTPITEILRVFSSGESLYYPVASRENKLLGIVSVEGIKSTLMERELGGMLLAHDIMEPAPAAIRDDSSLSDAGEAMKKHGIEFIPVEDSSGALKGFIEERLLRRYISSRLLDMKTKITELEKRKTRT